ncbi:MAG: alpha/beta fold hydrolase [Rhodanobacter sp.]|uniref:Lysophospholipase n=2 Tax=Rhodanobacter glycinis TaxID=582702 RepID=A0A5B9E866_9GAMM|nr:lysophospholipase [Rhodanobacter glycinis]TAM15574.1 MAG: alpha/beta fold hydrolase [Rhodanobacter sp.]
MVATPLLAYAATGYGGRSEEVKVSAPSPGALLSASPTAVSPLLAHAGKRYLITYRSRGVQGEPIVVSGYALLPKGQPPKGGWPVLAWAHGTTGIADPCAPSADFPGGPVHGYQELIDKALDWWLAQGYAVVATDYQGLGTPGGHPYMNAVSQLHTVDDSVRALHRLRPGAFSPDWLVMGHSQGGAAALEVAAHGQADVPNLKLRGAIAIAPGGYHYSAIVPYLRANPHPPVGVALFFPILLEGAQTADPSLHVDDLVSPDMQPLMALARSRCLSEMREEVHEAPARLFKPDADLKPLVSYLDRQALEHMSPTVPVMVIQGEADQLVDPRGTKAWYQQTCKAGKTVFFDAVAHGSHRDALNQSPQGAKNFLAYLNGQKSMQSCAALAPAGGH